MRARPGRYAVYVRYFSTTGQGSAIIERGIELINPGVNVKSNSYPVKAIEEIKLFKKNLALGEGGDDVKRLQQFLNTHGYPVAKSGPGSLKNEITRYGQATKQALMKFQKANKIIPANGVFGEKTRSVINNYLKNGR